MYKLLCICITEVLKQHLTAVSSLFKHIHMVLFTYSVIILKKSNNNIATNAYCLHFFCRECDVTAPNKKAVLTR